MDDLCQEFFNHFTLTPEYENYSRKHELYNGSTEIWKMPDYSGWIKLFAYAVIITGGLFGNICVILTIALKKSMRTTINLYIANLAVADSMICIICMVPHALTVIIGNFFVMGEFMCKFNPFIQMACMTSSVLTLSAISCDRFMGIMFPMKWRITKHRPSLVMPVIWTVSIAVSVPFLIVKRLTVTEWKNFENPECTEKWQRKVYYDEEAEECSFYEPLKSFYYVFVSISLFFLPALIMITAYSLILCQLFSWKMPGEQHAANVNAHSKSKKKVIKMIFTVLVAFIICWTPIQFTILFSALKPKQLPEWFTEYEWFSYYIAYANSFINPIIYRGFDKAFRDGCSFICQCNCRGEVFVGLAQWTSTLSSRLSRYSFGNISRTKSGSKRHSEEKVNPEMISLHPVTVDAQDPKIKDISGCHS